MATTPRLPGRLADAEMTVLTDPRTNPKLVQAFLMAGMDGQKADPFATVADAQLSSSGMMAITHKRGMKLYDLLPNALPEDSMEPEIEESVRGFQSFDGSERKLHVFRPAREKREGVKLPGVVYIHGGAMVVNDTSNKVHMRWCRSIATQGVVVVAVDFRNAWTAEGHNPFPTGLNDCVAGVRYVSAHREELGIAQLVLQGESGGANLSLATTLRAKREGWLEEIAGVFAAVPYISNGYRWTDARKLAELPSLYECDGYLLHGRAMAGMSRYYSPDPANDENPLAWPYHVSVEECEGLPPHVLSMDELDPLRDEGMAHYRKLLAAGVDVTAQVNLGVTHATSLVFRQMLPEVHNKAVREIAMFAKSV